MVPRTFVCWANYSLSARVAWDGSDYLVQRTLAVTILSKTVWNVSHMRSPSYIITVTADGSVPNWH